jgi:nicotinamidase-related amidase
MNTALVIVDMLQDFVDGRLANPAAVPTIERIGALAEAARGREDWIVVYGNDAHQPGDVELRLFGEHAMVGTQGAEVIEALAPSAGTSWCPSATTRPSPRPTWRPPAWCTTSAGW